MMSSGCSRSPVACSIAPYASVQKSVKTFAAPAYSRRLPPSLRAIPVWTKESGIGASDGARTHILQATPHEDGHDASGGCPGGGNNRLPGVASRRWRSSGGRPSIPGQARDRARRDAVAPGVPVRTSLKRPRWRRDETAIRGRERPAGREPGAPPGLGGERSSCRKLIISDRKDVGEAGQGQHDRDPGNWNPALSRGRTKRRAACRHRPQDEPDEPGAQAVEEAVEVTVGRARRGRFPHALETRTRPRYWSP